MFCIPKTSLHLFSLPSLPHSPTIGKATKGVFRKWITPCAVELVSRKVFDKIVAAKPFLRMETKDVNTKYVEEWSIEEIMGPVSRNVTPTWTRVLIAVTSPKFSLKGLDDDKETDQEEGAEENEGRNREIVSSMPILCLCLLTGPVV